MGKESPQADRTPHKAGEERRRGETPKRHFLTPGGWGISQLRGLSGGVPGYCAQPDILLGFGWFLLIPKNYAESESLMYNCP